MITGEGGGLSPSRGINELLRVAQALLELDPETDERSPEQVGADLVHLRHGIDLLEITFAKDAAIFAATSEYDAQGSVTAIDWIRHSCKMSGHAAAERVCVGEQLESLQQSVTAAAEGAIGYAHLALLARTAVWLGEQGKVFNESPLLEQAIEVSVSHLRHICHHARHAGDPDAYAEEQSGLVEERSLTRILLSADSSVIDVGRADRRPRGATRRAVNQRDEGCTWPLGCERPPSWTNVHHLKHWARGGPTDQENLTSLCLRHHWMVHEGGWQLIRDDTGRLFAIPPTVVKDMWTLRAETAGITPLTPDELYAAATSGPAVSG